MFSLQPKELDKALKLIDKNIKVIRYGYPETNYHGNCDSLTYKGEHIGSIPHGKVYDKRIPEYNVKVMDTLIAHRSLNDILKMVGQYIKPYQVKKFKQFIRTKNWDYLLDGD